MKKKILCLVLVFCFSFTFVACKKKDNLEKQAENLTSYEISVDLNVETKTATASQTVYYVNSSEDALKQIKFHLYPNFFEEGFLDYVVPHNKLNEAYKNGINYGNFDVSQVKVNKENSQINYEGEAEGILCVNLNNALLPEDVVQIDIDFSFTLPNCEHRYGYGNDTINLANFYPVACVYENGAFETSPYHSNGDPFYSEIANYKVDITLNKKYVVASCGEKLNEEGVNDNKTVTYQANVVRDFAMVISDKFSIINEKVGGTEVNYYYYKDNYPESSLKAGVDAVKTFSDFYGEYPYKTLAICQNDFVYGGMEYPTLIMISDDIEDADDYKNVIIHETAHQWWYGMVGNNEFVYPWLDESITEFSTLLFYKHNDGYNLTYDEMIKALKSNYHLFYTVYSDVLGTLDTSMRAVNEYQTEPEYVYATYVKGVLMYDSLYDLVGEKKFLASLKDYFNENKFKIATPDDLYNAFSKNCDKEVSKFFSSWVDGKVIIR
ncbi:MAG: M1 family metallopeptidase [Clostridiales bacterium]|nr:M1 family metallopeptidase [Clostridiales bacterium]